MSSILPQNESVELHKLDEIVSSRFEEFFALNLTAHPLSTDTKYLSVLSKVYDIDIVGLSESEAREILNLFYELRKYAGTVFVLKKVLSIFFSDVTVDDRVGNFEFDLSMQLQNDVSFDKIEKIKSLVNRYKNVRSHLQNIILNFANQETVFKIHSASVFGLDVYADTMIEHDMRDETHLNYGLNYRVCFDTKS
ncbi:MAG: hypothetical protein IBX44_02520 [Sulfurospirillum sp.]|nr:hypothetical protein [Sulfurospirillum sp.]